ncbi:MAG: Ig-like domain-containing protein [Bacteroidota bacterium]|nr:MAG: Ig-like domain-containing protein [Bacteroidota bacterium]
MKKNVFYFSLIGIAIGAMLFTTSCKDDPEDPTALTLTTLVAGDIDLNGATAPSNVPWKAGELVITATFATAVDDATATAANISLVRDYDDAVIDCDIEVSGAVITITPTVALTGGAKFLLSFETGLKATNGQVLGAEILRVFTCEGGFLPDPIAYWTFEDNADDQVGDWNSNAQVAIDYVAGRSTASGKAAAFNGTTSIIEIPNGDELMATSDFTLNFWVKAEESGKGHFIIGLAAFKGFQFELAADFTNFKMPVQYEFGDGTTGTGGDLGYNGDGKTKDNGGWRGTVFNKESTTLAEVLKNKWVMITYVYNSTLKQRMMFLNGELVIKQDFTLYIDDEGNPWNETTIVGLKYGGTPPDVLPELAFGFIQSRGGTMWDAEPWGGYDIPGANHFQGQLDDVSIHHIAVTEDQVLLMYNSSKP